MTTVYSYFKAQLGVSPDETSLQELNIDTACGQACCTVINAARCYLETADDHVDVRNPLIESVNNAVNILWIG